MLEFEEIMDGIPLTGQSITLLGSSAMSCMRLAYVAALAEKRGIDFREVNGSVTEYPFVALSDKPTICLSTSSSSFGWTLRNSL